MLDFQRAGCIGRYSGLRQCLPLQVTFDFCLAATAPTTAQVESCLGGEIYNFAKTETNDSEFCGSCFDPDGQTLYVNQQGERGGPIEGPPSGQAVTYAIYGPFGRRAGANNKNFGN